MLVLRMANSPKNQLLSKMAKHLNDKLKVENAEISEHQDHHLQYKSDLGSGNLMTLDRILQNFFLNLSY